MNIRVRVPGFEPRISPPQGEVLTTILHTPGEAGYRSLYLSHAKRALYHLSYIPGYHIHTHNTNKIQFTDTPRAPNHILPYHTHHNTTAQPYHTFRTDILPPHNSHTHNRITRRLHIYRCLRTLIDRTRSVRGVMARARTDRRSRRAYSVRQHHRGSDQDVGHCGCSLSRSARVRRIPTILTLLEDVLATLARHGRRVKCARNC